MTVAPELPPVPVDRRAVVRRRADGRRLVAVDRTPAGVVALVEAPRPRRTLAAAVAPAAIVTAPVRPQLVPAAEPPEPAVETGTGREHRPAGPVPLRPTGPRVVRPAGGGLRLTRRGRLAAAAAVVLIAVLTLVGVTSRIGTLSESSPVPASAPAQVVVTPGETLWSIAERVAPQRDPRTVVAAIRSLNHLPGTDVRPGQTLLLRAP